MSKIKKIVFLTGTRADFGKLKSLIKVTSQCTDFDTHIFVTGMHLQDAYGYTVNEIIKSGFSNIHKFPNHTHESTMDLTLAKTIEGLSSFVNQHKVDLIVVHGDRVETLAGAIVGAMNNILVAHVEGGEVSGTIDELIRHSVSKLSHIHFVANEEAKTRLLQMGERESQIFVIGSPDVDIMFSDQLPNIESALHYYDIPFKDYSILMFHPVTTEQDMVLHANNLIEAVLEEGGNYLVIRPNNDMGSAVINEAISRLEGNERFAVFPSLRFEFFLVLLKHCQCIIGNSSAGVREAPLYGVTSIDIGNRQLNRVKAKSIIHCSYTKKDIQSSINKAKEHRSEKVELFGQGNSDALFLEILASHELWAIQCQKQFKDRLLRE
ncbi:MAG: UDP-N-acetylglucosamine 2-epimerase [Bacteroidota bacterium]|nr:UDP-N-acetylglucosamine 2-epimerase [Bacteroidota bacterium]